MTMLHEDKPYLDDDLLEHHGIKGMRWGVRNRKTAGQIRTARRSVAKSRLDYNEARDQHMQGNVSKRAVSQAKLAFLNNPNRATASRLTRGEHAAAFILLSPVGAAGLTVGMQARSRYIEGRQVTDKYSGKK